ncbi:hypothetical protein HDU83_001335 [Entophlyctis luteolus]|nr:hypothetical protein HDU83_001335 [Entophlyctis luteolus]
MASPQVCADSDDGDDEFVSAVEDSPDLSLMQPDGEDSAPLLEAIDESTPRASNLLSSRSASASRPVVIPRGAEVPQVFADRPALVVVHSPPSTSLASTSSSTGSYSAASASSSPHSQVYHAIRYNAPSPSPLQARVFSNRTDDSEADSTSTVTVQNAHAQPFITNRPIRLRSLDVFRGIAVLGMIVANFQTDNAWTLLKHTDWIGLTPVDLIFPAFVFIMGVSIPLSVKSGKLSFWSVTARSSKLFGIGLILNLPAKSIVDFRIMG